MLLNMRIVNVASSIFETEKRSSSVWDLSQAAVIASHWLSVGCKPYPACILTKVDGQLRSSWKSFFKNYLLCVILHCKTYSKVNQAILISVEGFKNDKRGDSSNNGLGVSPLIERKRKTSVDVGEHADVPDDFKEEVDNRVAVFKAGIKRAS